MTVRARLTAALTAAVVLAPAAALQSAAAGGVSPIVGAAPSGAIAIADGDQRFRIQELARGTLITSSGRTNARLRLSQPFMLAAVAHDGTAGGLSADGRTLVLSRPETEALPGRSRFAVIDAARLRLRRTITLRGTFGFDALSPDGRWLYLIEATGGPGAYSVRAYDFREHRLFRNVVIDPSEKPSEMWGNPMARVTSPDGRWAYTLYDGADHDFIHVLDTANRGAKCIDLPHLPAHVGDIEMAITPDGGLLSLGRGGRLLANVDLSSYRVSLSEPETRVAPHRHEAAASDGGGGFPWLVLPAAGLLLAGGLIPLRRRQTAAPTRPGRP
jgi:hypothetical protein